MNFDLRETVNRRKSVRSYEKRPLSQSDREAISAVIDDCRYNNHRSCTAEGPGCINL